VAVASVAQAGLSENTYPGTHSRRPCARPRRLRCIAAGTAVKSVRRSRRRRHGHGCHGRRRCRLRRLRRLFVGDNMCLLQHALEARDHMRRRPRACEAIPAVTCDWLGGFTSQIAVVLSMLQDVHHDAHLLPLASACCHLIPPAPTCSHLLPPASTGQHRPQHQKPLVPPIRAYPRRRVPRRVRPTLHCRRRLGPCSFLLPLAFACAFAGFLLLLLLLLLPPCLASCNITLAPRRRLDLPAAAMTPVWLPYPALPYSTLPSLNHTETLCAHSRQLTAVAARAG
jgi:hypothetical protein